MKKIFISTLIFVSFLGVGCANQVPTVQTDVKNEDTAAVSASTPVVIEYSDGQFNPSEARIAPGTTVVFKNLGNKSVWPASGAHPSHLICPGFDSESPLSKGDSYQFIFNDKKVCPFHNHLSASETGKIIVE